MKTFFVSLAALVAICYGQMAPRDPYQQVTYAILADDGEDAEVCATFRLAAQFMVGYNTTDPDKGFVNVEINLPPIPAPNTTDATPGDLAGSECPSNSTGNSTTVLRAVFGVDQMFIMEVNGVQPGANVEPDSWEVTMIEFRYNLGDPDYFPDSGSSASFSVKVTDPAAINIRASRGQLFQCNSQSVIDLPGDNSPNVELKFKDVLLNPFNTTTDGGNSACSADTTSSSDKTVPIAVGASLGGLLLLVIIAFIIGRRMRTKAGYQKV